MTRWTAVLVAATLLQPGQGAYAHRLDEYLQATLLSLRTDRIDGSMRLVAGELVSESVIAQIDGDHDGVFSEREQRAYALRVVGDLSLRIDGRQARAELVAWQFPTPAQMRSGLGEIHVQYRLAVPQGGGERTFLLANRHRSRQSVYLANVIVPEGAGLRIVAQKRNARQSVYELRYRQGQSSGSGAT
jgi:hypothetical protein